MTGFLTGCRLALWGWLWLGLAAACLLGPPAFGRGASEDGPLDLDQPTTLYRWKYRSGDNPAWAAPDFDDADWALLDLTPGPRFPNGPRLGLGWYRAEVTVINAHRPGIRPFHLASVCAYEAYVNGERVGQYGKVAPQPRFPDGRFQPPIAIPAEALRPDGRLVIAIRARERSGMLENSVAFLGAQLGDVNRLASEVAQRRAEAMRRDVARLSFVFAFAFFALYHLYLYGNLFAYGHKKDCAEYLWLGIVALGYAVNSLSISSALTDHFSPTAYRLLNAVSVHAQLLGGAAFIYSFLRRPMPRWARWHQASQVACIAGTLAFPSWALSQSVNQPLFAASVLSLLLPVAAQIVRLARQGVAEAQTLRLAISLIAGAEAIQVARLALSALGVSEESWARWVFHGSFNYAVDVSFSYFLLAMAVTVARRYRDEIEAANRNLESAVAERTAEVRRQRDELESKNQDIEDSLRYAQTMQQAILPALDDMRRGFAEVFVLWKPRDIVSGDFYWFHQTDAACLLIVADCTGHGVPGAFMAFIGNDLLNQIVVERGVDDPARILTELDAGVQRALKQSNQHGAGAGDSRVDDGMDIGVCRFSAEGVTFAGARRPLYVVADGRVTEYPGARHPIGGRARKARRFENAAVAVAPNAMIYLATDGFADQPSADGKRFKTRSLIRLLEEIWAQPAAQQQAMLEACLARHAGGAAQRDDITVVGARLGHGLARYLNGEVTTAHGDS